MHDIVGENLLDHKMYNNWLFFPPFNFPPKKRGIEENYTMEEKKNKLAKLVLKKVF